MLFRSAFTLGSFVNGYPSFIESINVTTGLGQTLPVTCEGRQNAGIGYYIINGISYLWQINSRLSTTPSKFNLGESGGPQIQN